MSTPKPIPLPFTAKVAGVSFHQEVVRGLQEGDLLEVVHDPENPYDATAYAVKRLDGTLVGHLPRELAARLHVREEGGRYQGSVREVLRQETWGLRIQVARDQHERVRLERLAAEEQASGGPWPEPEGIAPDVDSVTEALREHAEARAQDALEDALAAAAAFDTMRAGSVPDDLSGLLEASAPAVSAVGGKIVRARSGRVLGTFLRSEGGKVVARSSAGHEVSYPERVVVVSEE